MTRQARPASAALLLLVATLPQAPAQEQQDSEPSLQARNALAEWGYGTGYNPSVVNMRVSSNLQTQINQYDFDDAWLDGPFMTGTWGGVREWLFENGVEFSGGYIGNPFWNPTGGTEQAFRWHHHVSGTLNFDFEKMAGLEGSSFTVSGRWRGGGYLSEVVGITGLYEPSAYVGSEGWRMLQTFYRQTFLDDRIVVHLGRQVACDPFADLPITYIFINDAIDANIVGFSENIPFSTGALTWAGFIRTWPTEEIYLQFGAYNNPAGVTDESNHGVDLAIREEDGTIFIAELCWDPTERFGNKPGSYLIGGYSATGEEIYDYPSGNQADGTFGLYAAATQMVYSESEEADQQGLSLFVTGNWCPPSENQLAWYVSGGLVYVGPIPERDNDQVGLAFAYSNYSNAYSDFSVATGGAPQDEQTVIELTYAYGVTPWFVVQPDVQYFFDPAANGSVPDALVLGVTIALSF